MNSLEYRPVDVTLEHWGSPAMQIMFHNVHAWPDTEISARFALSQPFSFVALIKKKINSGGSSSLLAQPFSLWNKMKLCSNKPQVSLSWVSAEVPNSSSAMTQSCLVRKQPKKIPFHLCQLEGKWINKSQWGKWYETLLQTTVKVLKHNLIQIPTPGRCSLVPKRERKKVSWLTRAAEHSSQAGFILYPCPISTNFTTNIPSKVTIPICWKWLNVFSVLSCCGDKVCMVRWQMKRWRKFQKWKSCSTEH